MLEVWKRRVIINVFGRKNATTHRIKWFGQVQKLPEQRIIKQQTQHILREREGKNRTKWLKAVGEKQKKIRIICNKACYYIKLIQTSSDYL